VALVLTDPQWLRKSHLPWISLIALHRVACVARCGPLHCRRRPYGTSDYLERSRARQGAAHGGLQIPYMHVTHDRHHITSLDEYERKGFDTHTAKHERTDTGDLKT
jgi:hypothetical protein